MKIIIPASCFALFLTATVNAQETQRLALDIGGGFTQTVGNTGRNLNNGWNIGGGVGYNFSPYLGAMVQTNYNAMGINSTTLNNLGFPGGDVHIFSATIDPIVHLHPRGHYDFYLVGGGGLYRVRQEFTAPTISTVTGFNPIFGFNTVGVPSTEVLASNSVNKPGANIGAGVAFGTKWNAKFYAEARWNHVYNLYGQHLDYVPVTFGIRW
jgi:opacity protein-like surface antigen